MDIVDRLKARVAADTGDKTAPLTAVPNYMLHREAAAEITLLRKERDEARLRFDQTDGIEGGACHAIRELLKSHGVPEAAFIDNFVGNAIAQRDEARAVLREISEDLGARPYSKKFYRAYTLAYDFLYKIDAIPTPEATK